MKTRILGTFFMSAALMLGASKPVTDTAIGNELRRQIVAYSHYTVSDDVGYHVTNGQVNLTGMVTDRSKKIDIEKLASSIRGVAGVTDNIQVLPNSPIDRQLGAQIARSIYASPVFDRYTYAAQKPVRVIVDHGHVTLEGVVQTQLEKQVAGINAAAAGLRAGPIVNHLRVVPASQKS